jgi:hypothetical protein
MKRTMAILSTNETHGNDNNEVSVTTVELRLLPNKRSIRLLRPQYHELVGPRYGHPRKIKNFRQSDVRSMVVLGVAPVKNWLLVV